LALILTAPAAIAQSAPENPYFARKNAFGVFTAYSNDSSHMLLGYANSRKLLDIGASYSRRLIVNRIVNWQYDGEILPVALESDPVAQQTVYQTSPTELTEVEPNTVPFTACVPGTVSFNETFNSNGTPITYAGTIVTTCSRQWTIGEGISPVGFRWNFMPRRKIQPFFIGHGGYMYSTRPIPVESAGSFNFTFDIGAGLELYRSKTKSIRAEFRYHHISNHNTATVNPGIDSGLYQVTYSFGR
jgi:opacity protein-like surface antigen